MDKLNITNVKDKYIDSKGETALNEFISSFYSLISEYENSYSEIIILCIGTDRATGDCLGPLIGSKLESAIENINDVILYGTLDNPIHAKNLNDTISRIKVNHQNPIIIAIDASLGLEYRIGHVKIGMGSVKPGEGVHKNLPSVGDFYITGIVNFNDGEMNTLIIQTTKLSIVMKMADIITKGIEDVLKKIRYL